MRCQVQIGVYEGVVIVDVRGVTVTSRATDPELSRTADAGLYHAACYEGPVPEVAPGQRGVRAPSQTQALPERLTAALGAS